MYRSRLIGALCASFCLMVPFTAGMLPVDAWAVSIPDAHYELGVSSQVEPGGIVFPVFGVGSIGHTYCTPGGGCETSSAVMNAPDMTISGNMYGLIGTIPSSASGIIQYYYAVIGPADVSVPMLISASVSTSVFGGPPGGTVTGVTGRVVWTTGSGSGTESIIGCSTLDPGGCNAGGGAYYPSSASVVDHPFSVSANAVQQIALSLTGSAGYGTVTSYYEGSVDPLVNIDPAWLADNPGYSLEFSSNISTVPLPAAIWLFGGGLMGLIGAGRGRR